MTVRNAATALRAHIGCADAVNVGAIACSYSTEL